MKKVILAALCFVGIVSQQAYAADSNKETLVLMPIIGVNLLVNDILERDNLTLEATADVAEDDGSFESFKKKQQADFEAFKRGGPSPQAIVARRHADEKKLADRIANEEKLLQSSFQWALREGLQNRYQVYSGGDHPDAKLVATGSITKRAYGYFLEVTIKDASNKVAYANSTPCQECNEIQVGVKFKDLGNVQPVVVAAPQPVPKSIPQAAPVASDDGCYADEFVQVCIIKAEGGKNKLPKLTFSLKNLTDDKLFLGRVSGLVVKDDDGNECTNDPDGINFIPGSNIEGDFRSLLPRKSFNFYWNWKCQGQASGNELLASMRFVRLSEGKRFEFNVAAPVSGWKSDHVANGGQ
jgi:hypothetical protein